MWFADWRVGGLAGYVAWSTSWGLTDIAASSTDLRVDGLRGFVGYFAA